MKALLCATFAILGHAMELAMDNWESEVEGKGIFLFFFAPWCGFCRQMQPDWHKLMDHYKNSKTTLVADVDCTGVGKSLCSEMGVTGYPTIKYRNYYLEPDSLYRYKGANHFDSLMKFADKTFSPQCGPHNLDLCDGDAKTRISQFQKMLAGELDAAITEHNRAFTKLRKEVFDLSEQVMNKYSEKKDKEREITHMKASGPPDVLETLQKEFKEFTQDLLTSQRARNKREQEFDDVNKSFVLMKSVRAHAKLANSEL